MFREVLLDPKEWNYHRFLRCSPKGNMEYQQMQRLTFGVAASPYLAPQVLQQVAKDHTAQYPLAAEVINTTFYVDDRLTGAPEPREAIELQRQLFHLLQQAGMKLRKWRSNSQKFSTPFLQNSRKWKEAI